MLYERETLTCRVTPLTLLRLLCYVVSPQLSPSNNFARIQPYLHTSLKKLSGWDQPRASLRMMASNKKVLMGHRVRINKSP